MKNMFIAADHLTGRYWVFERYYVTDNRDGTWHITPWHAGYEHELDTDADGVQWLVDRLTKAVENSRMKDKAALTIEDITRDNYEAVEDGLMRGYDSYTCMIDSYRQTERAEANNRAILALVERIDKVFKAADKAA